MLLIALTGIMSAKKSFCSHKKSAMRAFRPLLKGRKLAIQKLKEGNT